MLAADRPFHSTTAGLSSGQPTPPERKHMRRFLVLATLALLCSGFSGCAESLRYLCDQNEVQSVPAQAQIEKDLEEVLDGLKKAGFIADSLADLLRSYVGGDLQEWADGLEKGSQFLDDVLGHLKTLQRVLALLQTFCPPEEGALADSSAEMTVIFPDGSRFTLSMKPERTHSPRPQPRR